VFGLLVFLDTELSFFQTIGFGPKKLVKLIGGTITHASVFLLQRRFGAVG
jgi:hypothetical protein